MPSLTAKKKRKDVPDEILALERAIVDNPRDLDSCGVYADWLQDQGDPMGNALALHVAILQATDPKQQTELKIALKAAIASPELFGVTTTHLGRLDLVWYLGVLERISMRVNPITDKEMSTSDVIATLLTLPVARFVSRLAISKSTFEAFTKQLPDVCAAGALRHLRAFSVEDVARAPRAPRAELARLNLLDGLTFLSIGCESFDFSNLTLPALKTLALTSMKDDARDVGTIIAAKLPCLERLTVPCAITTDLSAFAVFPKLRTIRVTSSATFAGGATPLVLRLRTELPKIETYELNDLNRKAFEREQKRLPDVHFVQRKKMHLD